MSFSSTRARKYPFGTAAVGTGGETYGQTNVVVGADGTGHGYDVDD